MQEGNAAVFIFIFYFLFFWNKRLKSLDIICFFVEIIRCSSVSSCGELLLSLPEFYSKMFFL